MVPPEMVEALRALDTPPPLPPHVDRLVLVEAERAFAGEARRRQNRFRIQRLAAAAAGIAVFVLVGTLVSRRTRPAPEPPRMPADVDGNGTVDILDAFTLARRIEAQTPVGPWDLNRDGRVDRSDADVIAMRAVRLGEGADHPGAPARLMTMDLYLESPRPLAAYQVELALADGVTLAGIEGGEAPFGDLPYYDPAAISARGRAVIAAFGTGAGASGRVRVARLHVQADADPSVAARVMAAAAGDGAPVEPAATLEVRRAP